jgi:hypothetical protein
MGFFDRFSGSKSPASPPPPSGVSPTGSQAAFTVFAAASGAAVDHLDAPAAVRLMLDFFRSVPAEGCLPRAEDGDMLLCQWGVYDWGSGESFEFNLTRQFTATDDEADDAISQLLLTLFFSPSDALRAVPKGDRWCRDADGLNEFEQFINGGAAYQAVAASQPQRVELRWEAV